MAGRKRVSHENQDGLEQKHRHAKKEPQLLSERFHGWDEGPLSIGETPFWPQVEQHTALLAMAVSDEQRAYITLQLQRNYGNKYVQRVVERNREKEGSLKSLKTKTDPGIETVSRQGVERPPIFAEISSTMPEIQRMEEQKEPTHEEEQPTNEPTLESAIALLRYNINELKQADGKEKEKWFKEVLEASQRVELLGGDEKLIEEARQAVLEGGEALLKYNIHELRQADGKEKEKWFKEVLEANQLVQLFSEDEKLKAKLEEEAHKAVVEAGEALLKYNIHELRQADGKEKEEKAKEVLEASQLIELFSEDEKLVEEARQAALEASAFLP